MPDIATGQTCRRPRKIAVAGTCQAVDIARCMQLLVPYISVVGLHVGVDDDARIRGSDIVFIQTVMAGRIAADYPALENLIPRSDLWSHDRPELRLMPTFQHLGFHPDLTYAWVNGRETLKSPLGEYNSALTVHAWLKGWSLSKTEALFCDTVYHHLGYYDRLRRSERSLLQDGYFCGIDIAPLLAGWRRTGCFCHSTNHPKLVVLSSYARAALDSAGIGRVRVSPEHILDDTLASSGIWPVYPEIGASLGVDGGFAFVPPRHGSGSERRPLDLREFIERSFAMYERISPNGLTMSRSVDDDRRFATTGSPVIKPAASWQPR